MNKLNILKEFDHRQLFRFFVDGRLYTKENGWEGYENRQPGCIKGMSLAYTHMLNNFELKDGLTLEYISKLHDLTFFNIDKKLRKNRYPGEVREFRISFLIKPVVTKEGIKELMGDRALTDAFKKGIRDCNNAEDIYNAIINGKKIRYISEVGELSYELNQASLDKEPKDLYLQARAQVKKNITQKLISIIDEYNKIINTLKKEEKLYFIVDVVKSLDRLHPFVDGNIRVFVTILLNHLLMLNDFYPVIFEEPSIFDAYSTNEILVEIEKGQKLVKQLIENPESKVFGHSISDENEVNINEICTLMSEFIQAIQKYDN
ncbi:MAG: Fic family protein [Sulfurimonas sp.]|nr:Fic family protein [Sulfurimonas sp.]MDQ7059911.1 Fic family protein [Sulfurimonas sp.]